MAYENQRFIGICTYTKSDRPGVLSAQWVRSDWVENPDNKRIVCQGVATGPEKEGYAGVYSVVYDDEDGNTCEPFTVTIRTAGEAYLLSWEISGEDVLVGVGFETRDQLVFAWMPKHQLS
ncbi:MAG: hypothetical protein GY947_12275 [Rhodobacteraceae bacterium]|nr:hypothetical protein [Paracoccaceae bacterium]